MDVYLYLAPTRATTYDELATAAATARLAGFDGVALNDHLLAFNGSHQSGDPFVTAAGLFGTVLAGHTTRVAVLVANCMVRPAALTLAMTAQLHTMSAGRFDLGLGAGWNRTEAEAFGLPWPGVDDRYAELRRQVRLLDQWATRTAPDFGRGVTRYQLGDGVSRTLPALRELAQVPLLAGGRGPRAVALAGHPRVGEYNVPGMAVEPTRQRWEQAVASRPSTAGRLALSAAVNVCVADTPNEARRAVQGQYGPPQAPQHWLTGTAAAVALGLAGYQRSGADRLYLRVVDYTDREELETLGFRVLPRLRELTAA